MILPLEIKIAVNPSYIDFSTGGLVAQVLIAGGISGLVLYRKVIWRRIKGMFRWKKK